MNWTALTLFNIIAGLGSYLPANDPNGTWTIGNLAAGASETLTILMTVGAGTADGAIEELRRRTGGSRGTCPRLPITRRVELPEVVDRGGHIDLVQRSSGRLPAAELNSTFEDRPAENEP